MGIKGEPDCTVLITLIIMAYETLHCSLVTPPDTTQSLGHMVLLYVQAQSLSKRSIGESDDILFDTYIISNQHITIRTVMLRIIAMQPLLSHAIVMAHTTLAVASVGSGTYGLQTYGGNSHELT